MQKKGAGRHMATARGGEGKWRMDMAIVANRGVSRVQGRREALRFPHSTRRGADWEVRVDDPSRTFFCGPGA